MTVAPRNLPRLLALAALLAAAGGGSAGAFEYRALTGVRPGHVAWMYAHPDPASARVGYLRAGLTSVRTLSCRRLAAGGWCHVTHLGTRGWVQDRFLKAPPVMRG